MNAKSFAMWEQPTVGIYVAKVPVLIVLLYSMIPDLDCPVWTAGDENTWVEVVPFDSIHRHIVSIIRLQQLVGVGFGALRTKGTVAITQVVSIISVQWLS